MDTLVPDAVVDTALRVLPVAPLLQPMLQALALPPRLSEASTYLLYTLVWCPRPAWVCPRTLLTDAIPHQCFLFSRNIGSVTPNIIYFKYLTKTFLDQSIPKIVYLILKKEALFQIGFPLCFYDASIMKLHAI